MYPLALLDTKILWYTGIMISLTLRLQNDIYEELRNEAFDSHKTISDVIRERIGSAPWQTIRKGRVIVAANSASPIKRGATPAKPPSPSTVQTKPLAHPWEPVDEDTTLKVVKELHRQQNNPRFSGAIASCKIHGIPLDARGRCMQKGCRYG